jgi:hypothetical protein
MKHRLLITIALTALLGAVAATSAAAERGHHHHRFRGELFQFRGEVVTATSTSVQVTVEGGNRAALRTMLGQSQNETFTIGPKTEILVWNAGVPHVASYGDLKPGTWVNVNIRARRGTDLAHLTATPAGTIGDRATKPTPPQYPLYLFRGTVDGPQSGGHVVLHVRGGNRRALRLLIGQSRDQTFTYGTSTIFLLWQGKVPTVIDASQLKAGDLITVRIRAPRLSTLAQVEATPAVHVGDHEPANAPDKS